MPNIIIDVEVGQTQLLHRVFLIQII